MIQEYIIIASIAIVILVLAILSIIEETKTNTNPEQRKKHTP